MASAVKRQVRDAWIGDRRSCSRMFIQLSSPKARSSESRTRSRAAGIEIGEFGREPRREALAQQLAQLGDAEADRRRDRAHALGEVPHRQPFLEQLGAVRHQQLDAARQRRLAVHRADAIEGAADREIERGGVEVGKIGEMLEERPAGDAGDGGNGGRRGLDIACLDKIKGRLDQRLARPQTANDAAILGARNVDRESDYFHIRQHNMNVFNGVILTRATRLIICKNAYLVRSDGLILLDCF